VWVRGSSVREGEKKIPAVEVTDSGLLSFCSLQMR